MKKYISIICIIATLISTTSCGRNLSRETEKKMTTQKEVARIAQYDNEIPDDYEWFDYRETALAYDSLVFDESLKGPYLPLIWSDKTNDTFGFAAYVGDARSGVDGAQGKNENTPYILYKLFDNMCNADKLIFMALALGMGKENLERRINVD